MNRKIVMSKGRKVECFMGGLGLPKVVILPGMSSSAYEWELVVNEWEEAAGFVIVHRPGCGQSEVGEEKRTTAQFATMNGKQLSGILDPVLSSAHQRLSDSAKSEIKTFLCSPFLYKAMASEIEHWEGCARRIKAMDSFPQVPLTVIGRDPTKSVLSSIQDGVPAEEAKMIETIWQELIQEQVGLSNQGTFISARQATHSIHLDRPDVIVEAMKLFLS
ncbi:hypothetical protein J31TS6_61500 [Brevibacillus reuszeri]|uniref:alpha/beta fold hydrolase n=1 Tax=Brevibacillus reuszeri TaxID=54915 RepID=UPI001B10FC40|nr:hypothetical protein [Brevibacillus reuszeri]GIO10122.1 hypothetical protein J31TS6_61500 [Brevibacillus reuszeri]